MSFVLFVAIWCALAAMVLVLALARKILSLREDDLIHLGPGEEKMIPKQVETFSKIQRIDQWGKALTIFVAASGLLLGALYLYKAF